MNLYDQNIWLYQPIVVELDDSSYYDEESCSTITSTSTLASSHTSASINNPGAVSSNIIVRSVIPPLYIPSPPCSPAPSRIVGADNRTKAETTTESLVDYRKVAASSSNKNKNSNHRRHRHQRQRQKHTEPSHPPPSSRRQAYKNTLSKQGNKSSVEGIEEEQPLRPRAQSREKGEIDEASTSSHFKATDNRKMNFHDAYVLTRQIDKGAFSTVWEAIHRTSGRRYAAKLIDRRTLSPTDDKSIYREVATLRHLHNLPPFRDDDDYYHDYDGGSSCCSSSSSKSAARHYASSNLGIIQIVDFYVEPTHFFLVTDYVGGGDLFARVLEKRYYDEETARELARGFFQSLFYLHSRNVVHRDIKPENLLLCSREDDVQLKIADFGFATRLRRADPARSSSRRRGAEASKEKEEEDYKVRDKCGTPSYVAPEVLRGVPYDTQADMWSAGVVMYFLMGGYPPFVDRKSRKGLFRKICRGEYEFHETDWSDVSADAKDFIRRLLTVCPEQRMTAEECLSHHWLRGNKSKKIVSTLEYSVSSKTSSPTKVPSSNDTKTTSMSSATAMSSTTSTITTSHLYISNSGINSKAGHPTTQMSNKVRSARKKLSKVFSSMKNGGSGTGSSGNGGGTTPASSSHPTSHNSQMRPRIGTTCSVTVASSQCDESVEQPPPPPARPPRRTAAILRPPPRRRTGTI